MQTYKLWLEPDPDIPQFRKLEFDVVDVEIKDVIEKGIHPAGEKQADSSLADKFAQLLNTDDSKVKELAGLDYCADIDARIRHYHYTTSDKFEDFLKRISSQIRFVEQLSFRELLELAKEQLRRSWSHTVAKSLAQRIHYGFNELRSFIKSKDKKVRLRSYDDLDSYDLGEVLCLEDFEAEDKILISEGLPVTNFRRANFLSQVTDDKGKLKLTESIDHFQLRATNGNPSYSQGYLTYNGHKQGGSIRLFPSLGADPVARTRAQKIAESWRLDEGNYCFKTDISRLSEMLATDEFRISFPRLDYMHNREPSLTTAGLQRSGIQRYAIGKYLTARHSGDSIKGVLRDHGVPMTGTKDQLVAKLAKLAARLYRKHRGDMRSFFEGHPFIKMQNGYGQNAKQFPILHDLDLRNLLLTMFAIRHLRGDVILDSSYETDTFDLQSLALSLVREEVQLSGCFLLVEE